MKGIRFQILPTLLISTGLLFGNPAYSDCTLPAGTSGQMQYVSGEMKFCDGTSWHSMKGSSVAGGCAVAGSFQYVVGTDFTWCDGSALWSAKGASTYGDCTGSAGKVVWDAGNSTMRGCVASTWVGLKPASSVNPTALSLSHTTNTKSFTVSWTAGSGNGGAGGCKVQYNKSGVWTDITTANCDANASNQSVTLPADGWFAGNWNGVQIRLARASDSQVLGTFAQALACSVTGGSAVSTPTIDEDCNGAWDNATTTSNTCTAYRYAWEHGTDYYEDTQCDSDYWVDWVLHENGDETFARHHLESTAAAPGTTPASITAANLSECQASQTTAEWDTGCIEEEGSGYYSYIDYDVWISSPCTSNSWAYACYIASAYF